MIANKNTSQSARIVFFGSSNFSLPSLEAAARLTRTLLVVTYACTRVGRTQTLTPSPVAVRAKALGIELFEVKNLKDDALLGRIQSFQPTVGICASFGMIFSADLLALFPKGIINVHPSLLPRHRGPSPVQWTIHVGDSKTGVTLFLIDEQVDHGPIIAQQHMAVPPTVSTPEFMSSLAILGGALLIQTLPGYLAGEIEPKPQDEAVATITSILTRDSGKINWATDDAAQIERNIRAFAPWPGVWCLFSGKRLIIESAEAVFHPMSKLSFDMSKLSFDGDSNVSGTVLLQRDGRVCIATVRGYLRPLRLQREGGKSMDVNEFLRGHQKFVGTLLQ